MASGYGSLPESETLKSSTKSSNRCSTCGLVVAALVVGLVGVGIGYGIGWVVKSNQVEQVFTEVPDGNNDDAVWFGDPSDIELVMREGDVIDGWVVLGPGLAGGPKEWGRQGGINEKGQFAVNDNITLHFAELKKYADAVAHK